jgi:hypothetical protein
MDNTITILVKEVPRIRIEGARERTVSKTNNWTPVVTCWGWSAGETEKVTPGADNAEDVSQEVNPNKTRDNAEMRKMILRFFFIVF